MGAGFHDPARLHNDDPVGFQHRCQAMGNNKRGAALHQPVQGILDQLLAFRIQRTGRFVEQKHRRILQDGAGDGDALALSARQGNAALAHGGFIAVGQVGDESVRMGRRGSRNDLVSGGIGPAVGDVFGNARSENRRVLGDQGNGASQILRIERTQIVPVESDLPRFRIVEPHQQVKQRRFSGP